MKTFILMIGLLLNDVAQPIADISGASFSSLQECESVKSNRAVTESYAESLGPDMVMWCVEAERADRNIVRALAGDSAKPVSLAQD